ncbi:MAG: hypothetical protein U9P72_06570 [Campylobacterota bacterium]|nr:hypothetical protein [Campylobacterota bacterium]
MTTKQHSHYLKFLAHGHHSLLVSNQSFEQFEELKEILDLSIQRAMNQDEIDNLTFTLMQNDIDIVIIDFTQEIPIAKEFLKTIKKYNDRIIIIGILNRETVVELVDILDILDSLLFEGFSIQELKDRFFVNLSVLYAIKAVGVRDMKLSSSSFNIDDDLDKFFDTYEGSSLFIVDELVELNKSLKSGELSVDILENVSIKMKELADIFSKNGNISDVTTVFKDFSSYLLTLDLTQIEPSSLYAFDYLCAIIDDVNTYMMEMFVDRIFRDVYIFEHSFENNLKFMKDALASNSEDEDDSELEFF